MASAKRLSRTSGNKRITLLGGAKLGDTITLLESSEEKSPNDVFHEERTTKDDTFLPTTSKIVTLKRSASTSSALLRYKASNRARGQTLALIEDKVEEEEDKDPSLHVLCPGTSSEDDDDDEETLKGASVVQASTVHENTTGDKSKLSKFDDTFVVAQPTSKKVTGGNKVQLEEKTSHTWELSNFTANYLRLLDNESKYSEENEAVPVKTSLIEIGEKIDCRSIFLANLYFSQSDDTDINKNQEGTVNLNLEKGTRRASVSYEANPLETTHILVMVTLKLVDNFSIHQGTYLHYRVDLESSGRILASFVHFLTPIKMGGLASVAVQLDMKRFFSKMDPEDSLQIKLHCHVYRPMIEWGLKAKDSEELYGFMLDGKKEKSNRRRVSELAEKCNELNLLGILECLESLVPYKFFEDE